MKSTYRRCRWYDVYPQLAFCIQLGYLLPYLEQESLGVKLQSFLDVRLNQPFKQLVSATPPVILSESANMDAVMAEPIPVPTASESDNLPATSSARWEAMKQTMLDQQSQNPRERDIRWSDKSQKNTAPAWSAALERLQYAPQMIQQQASHFLSQLLVEA